VSNNVMQCAWFGSDANTKRGGAGAFLRARSFEKVFIQYIK